MSTTSKWEVGKHYKLANGRRARIYAVEENEIHGAYYNKAGQEWYSHYWDINGNNMRENFDEELNLTTEEWREQPVVNWSAMPAWVNWVAMDSSDRLWYGYTNKPDLEFPLHNSDLHNERGAWNGDNLTHIPSAYAPTFTGDWKDSLVQRPT